ncbi:unnamed protein product, partial [Mesorhabditis belari]|uniref:Carboxylic ester hydrolase n=1 Tax=Mesorhabditis belari TaxID=2138241 RepID=A0AAF3F6U1_9BILA
MLIRLYFSVFAFFFSSVLAQNPLVITKYGAVIGASYPTPSGVVVSEFIGVPFAAPPLGNLRFERPKPPTPWTTPLNVSTYALDCVPCNLDWAEGPSSEDCLYLNIWTPSLNNSNLPVAVWIHGGGWGTGTAQMENKRIREIYGQNGIVVVSIAYRVGFFGFLTLNNTALPANLGLWDQNLALKWIQENIGRFGGDSKRVTVWGQSAGGASSGLHSLSPHSQGLFAQSFEQSGSPISDWGRGNPTMLQFSTDTLNKLGCPTSGDIKSCLKGKTLNELHTAVGACVIGDDMSFLALTPLVDGDFFTEQPEQAIKLYP